MTIKKSILATVVGAFTLIGAQSATAEVLRMGVEGTYPPFSKKKPTGRCRALTSISPLRFVRNLNANANWSSRNGTE